MSARKSLDASAMSFMVLLCFIWSLQQVILKAVAHDISPLYQIALRFGIAAVVVGALLRWQGLPLFGAQAPWRPGLVVGLLFAFEFFLVGESLRFTTASRMIVLLYTAPIVVALGMHFSVAAERLSRLQWLGVFLAFSGIAYAFLGGDASTAAHSAQQGSLWGDFLALLAGVFWGGTTLYIRQSRLSLAPAAQTLWYQLIAAFLVIGLWCVWTGQAHMRITPASVASLTFHALVLSVFSYLAWFSLLRRYKAAQLGVFSFLTPLMGVALGVVLLNEPLTTPFMIGATLVCAGIVLVNVQALWPRRTLQLRP